MGWRIDRAVLRMVFDAALAVVVGVVGFLVTGINGELRDVRVRNEEHTAAIANIRERLPLEYVRMDLYVRDRQEMMTLLRDIDRNIREHRERTSNGGVPK
jgi:hypothetical protein